MYDDECLDNTEINFEKNKTKPFFRNYTFNWQLNDVTEQKAKSLTHKWTCKHIVSYIITMNNIPTNKLISHYCYQTIYEAFKKYFPYTALLGVLKQQQTQSSNEQEEEIHLHILHISNRAQSQEEIQSHYNYFKNMNLTYSHAPPPNQEEYLDNFLHNTNHYSGINYSINIDVKRENNPCHIYHYLHQNMIGIFVNDLKLIKMFMYFKNEYSIGFCFDYNT